MNLEQSNCLNNKTILYDHNLIKLSYTEKNSISSLKNNTEICPVNITTAESNKSININKEKNSESTIDYSECSCSDKNFEVVKDCLKNAFIGQDELCIRKISLDTIIDVSIKDNLNSNNNSINKSIFNEEKEIYIENLSINDNTDNSLNIHNNRNEFITDEKNVLNILSNYNIDYVHPSLNYHNNYNNYVSSCISSIKKIKKIELLETAYIHKKINSNIFKAILSNDKSIEYTSNKIILIDLDETLVYSEFSSEKFSTASESEHIKITEFYDNECNETTHIKINIRHHALYFLDVCLKMFKAVGIFTASEKNYADAVIDKLISNGNKNYNKIFKIYRDSCIKVENIYIKDLRIFEDYLNLSDIVIIDNSLYSFCNQLSNGILINSYYSNEIDNELLNVINYIIQYIIPCNDVRFVNNQVFKFEEYLKKIR